MHNLEVFPNFNHLVGNGMFKEEIGKKGINDCMLSFSEIPGSIFHLTGRRVGIIFIATFPHCVHQAMELCWANSVVQLNCRCAVTKDKHVSFCWPIMEVRFAHEINENTFSEDFEIN